jgi:hypothetical protein
MTRTQRPATSRARSTSVKRRHRTAATPFTSLRGGLAEAMISYEGKPNLQPRTPEMLTMIVDPLLAQSTIDRLQSASFELVIEGASYRQRQKPTLDNLATEPPRRRTLTSDPHCTMITTAHDHRSGPMLMGRGHGRCNSRATIKQYVPNVLTTCFLRALISLFTTR